MPSPLSTVAMQYSKDYTATEISNMTKQPNVQTQFNGSVLNYTDCYAALLRYNLDQRIIDLPAASTAFCAASKALNALACVRINFTKTHKG